MIKLIAAADVNWGISKNGQIPWNFPEDLRFFREKTINGVVAMGKNTFFSIPNYPLKDRINCVISKTSGPLAGAEVFQSPKSVAEKYNDFWIIGGARLYNYALENDLVDYAIITRIRRDFDADRFICPLFLEKFTKNDIFSSDEYSIIEYRR
jgi:dihydrofolate reductase